LAVTINGVPTTDGWAYIPSESLVRFESSLPIVDDEVVITYRTYAN